jgi:hypothetical protein
MQIPNEAILAKILANLKKPWQKGKKLTFHEQFVCSQDRSCLGCALVFASEAKIETEAKISFRLEAKKRHDFTCFTLKVPKHEIFDRSDFPDFYTIKSLRMGDFGVKIKKNVLKNI